MSRPPYPLDVGFNSVFGANSGLLCRECIRKWFHAIEHIIADSNKPSNGKYRANAQHFYIHWLLVTYIWRKVKCIKHNFHSIA